MKLNLPFSKTGMMLNLEEELDYEILESAIASMPKSGKSEDELVNWSWRRWLIPTAAEAAAKEDGIIIMVSHCGDGHGGEGFYQALKECENPKALMEEILKVPQEETKPDQWEYQIQSRILIHHRVIYVMCEEYRDMAKEMGFEVAADVNEALEMAIREKGRDAHITVIPEGVSVMVKEAI